MATERGNEEPEAISVCKTEELIKDDEKESLHLGHTILPISHSEVNTDSSLLQDFVMIDQEEPMEVKNHSRSPPVQSVSTPIIHSDGKSQSMDNANMEQSESISSSSILSRSISITDNSEMNKPVFTLTSRSVSETDSVLQDELEKLGLSGNEVKYVISQGKKFFKKSDILANKMKVSIETAKSALNLLKSSLSEPEKSLTSEEILKIEECMKENPEYGAEDIALMCDIEEALVTKHLLSLPLTPIQKEKVAGMFLSNYPIGNIANMLKLSVEKVDEYIVETFITFAGIEGNCILLIIQNNFGNISVSKLRDLIVKKDIKLQDQLGCILCDKNNEEFKKLHEYFNKFEESRTFLQFGMTLTEEDILTIRQSDCTNLEQLSAKLHKVQTVIRNYLEQYNPCLTDRRHKMGKQMTEMQQIVNTFGNIQLTFHTYKMIISDSLEELIQQSDWSSKQPRNAFKELLPQIFYYLKCSLPFKHLSNMIAYPYKRVFTTHDLFHLIFQLSDPVLKGFCLEHYSFSNPIPFIYPQLPNAETKILKTTVCEELWYSLEDFNGLVSFGLGGASWNPVGKSYLLDLIFETDFVKGSPQNSAFHYSSIDIQMTKNLFGEMKDRSSKESTKWAYIDCHGESNVNYIKVICQHIDIALVHVTYQDFMGHHGLVDTEIKKFTKHVKYIYLLIRDCPIIEEDVKREEMKIADKSVTLFYIPNLTKSDVRLYSVEKSLKAIGYEILHLQPKKMVNSEFIENILSDLDLVGLKEIQSNKELIHKIISYIHKKTKSTGKLDFSFLSFYPHFIRDMSCYHNTTFETDQETIAGLNAEREELEEYYKSGKICEVVPYFNEITSKHHSTLVIWKLSEELTILSKRIIKDLQNTSVEQKNYRCTIEILWREALLSYIHTENLRNKDFSETFPKNFSNHVESGEAFELIDGDNLRFFHKDINSLLQDLYKKQFEEQKTKNVPMKKQAPIVVSIIGPQSSGKSTLLNYCFGCKFLTSSGRCTRGIYASLSKLSRPVNLSEHFLILDTEGLDAIERGNIQDTSHIHFDRTMVLFCLSVSQVVIINVKGDMGSEMQNLLQICAYSLNKLKVSKVAVPKIFFVLNQQADPDQSKHIKTINLLIEKLNKESNLIDTEGVKVSDLIQISRENLFVLPSAFNSEQINQPNAKLFDSKVSKLTPTSTFAEKCAELRIAIINRLDKIPTKDDIQPFETMEEWMDISGTVWDTLIRYQDIVKYRNVAEIICNKELKELVYELMKTHIHNEKENLNNTVDELINEINKMEITDSHTLSEKTIIFKQIFTKHRDVCLKEFSKHCGSKRKLIKVPHMCEEHESNLERLIYIEGKTHSDKLKYQIDSLLTENKITESMKNFQAEIVKNVDKYLTKTEAEQITSFQNIWKKCFRGDDKEEDEKERNENFKILYSNFRMESISLESETSIFHTFQDLNFQMDQIISNFKSDIITRFQNTPHSDRSEQFIYVFENNHSLKSMTPFPGGSEKFEYMCQETLYSKTTVISWITYNSKEGITISDWVPKECYSIVKYCSGYCDNVSIKWKGTSKNQQRLLLASQLRHPYNSRISTWEKLIIDISKEVQSFIENDNKISQGTVRQIIAYLHHQFHIVNYEIDYIGAKLTNVAETTILTLMFAYAFQSFWKVKTEKRRENERKRESEREKLLDYFLQKIENRKMVRGEWNRQTMKESDKKMSEKFAHDFIESLKRGVQSTHQPVINKEFKDREEELSHESIFLSANNTISKEIKNTPDHSKVDIDNFVVQYICNRNKLFTKEFNKYWNQIEVEIFRQTAKKMKYDFQDQLEGMKMAIQELLHSLKHSKYDKKEFDSENNFEISDINAYRNNPELLLKAKESPFKAMVMYLRMYLDPKVTSEEFSNTFKGIFKVDDIEMKTSNTFILCKIKQTPTHELYCDIFKKLSNTKMFNNENIFNIIEYITNYVEILNKSCYELTIGEFSEMIDNQKQESEKNAIGCPFKCPGCGKLCERKLHPNDGKCQIKTGHQICSMGGRICYDNSESTAVLKMCDDYKDDYPITLKGVRKNWGQFREIRGSTWDWSLPTEEIYVSLQRYNREKMMKIWNKFGEAILQCYNINIKYVPYTFVDDVYKSNS